VTTPILPVGKIVYVCDDVVADPLSHKPSVLNLWEIIRVHDEASFPYTLEKICVVALMRGGKGDVRFRADVVRADTLYVIRRSRDYVVSFSDRLQSKLVAIRLKDVSLPGPGPYLVELFCDGNFFDDYPIAVFPS